MAIIVDIARKWDIVSLMLGSIARNRNLNAEYVE